MIAESLITEQPRVNKPLSEERKSTTSLSTKLDAIRQKLGNKGSRAAEAQSTSHEQSAVHTRVTGPSLYMPGEIALKTYAFKK